MKEAILFTSLSLLVLANILASIYVLKAAAYDSKQKKMQMVIIWVVPYIGAFITSWFLWHDRKASRFTREVGNNTSITSEEAIHHYRGADHRGGR